MANLNGKVALVTGASRGIGKAIATELQAQGATVIGTATSENGASAIAEYLDSGAGKVLDVSSLESIEGLLKAIKEEFGDIDILVNNAGITRDSVAARSKLCRSRVSVQLSRWL